MIAAQRDTRYGKGVGALRYLKRPLCKYFSKDPYDPYCLNMGRFVSWNRLRSINSRAYPKRPFRAADPTSAPGAKRATKAVNLTAPGK